MTEFKLNVKYPYYAFSIITLHIGLWMLKVCNFQKSKCTINGVFVSQKKEPILNCPKQVVSNSSLISWMSLH